MHPFIYHTLGLGVGMVFVSIRSKGHEEKPPKRARAMVQRSFLELARMAPGPLTEAMIQDGLSESLAGSSCPHCAGRGEGQEQRYSARCSLGQLVTHAGGGPDINTRSVHYRCEACRRRFGVAAGSPIFLDGGGGQYGPTYMLLALWNCQESEANQETTTLRRSCY